MPAHISSTCKLDLPKSHSMSYRVTTQVAVICFLLVSCSATTADSAATTSRGASATSLPPVTTTTIAPTTPTTWAPTTTTTAQPVPRCRPNPFSDGFADELAADYPSAQLTAHVYDTRTDCSYSLNADNRQRTASIFKVMVMAGTLLEAQEASREVSDWELGEMTPMITRSTNPPVRALWRSFGAGSWFTRQTEIFGLNQTEVEGEDGVTPWGRTHTSALDQVNLIRQVLLGHWGRLDTGSRATALDLMTSVVPSQTWGITAGVPDNWTVAQKNGFAGPIINSAGWIDEPGESEGYVVAILTEGWGSHAAGIAVVERIAEAINRAMLVASRAHNPDGVD